MKYRLDIIDIRRMHAGNGAVVGGKAIAILDAFVLIVLLDHPLDDLAHQRNMNNDAGGLENAVSFRGI